MAQMAGGDGATVDGQEAAGAASEPMTRRERKRFERMQWILDVTAAQLTHRGYHHMSLEDVASELDLTKASIYHYFDSKEALVLTVLEACATDVNRQLWDAAKSDESASDRLQRMIEIQIRSVVWNYPEAARLFTSSDDWPDEIGVRVRKWRQEHDDAFKVVFREGIASGEFDVLDGRVARFALHGAMHGASNWIEDGDLDERLLDTVVQQFLRFVIAR